jgi:hypothetical protein
MFGCRRAGYPGVAVTDGNELLQAIVVAAPAEPLTETRSIGPISGEKFGAEPGKATSIHSPQAWKIFVST